MYNYNEKKLIEKVKNREMLTETEVKILVQEFGYDEEIEDIGARWVLGARTIIEIEDGFYSLHWYCGKTEYQENEYSAQIAVPVERRKVIIERDEWVEI